MCCCLIKTANTFFPPELYSMAFHSNQFFISQYVPMACLMIRTGREKLGTGSWEGWGDKERWKGEEREGIGRQAWVILLQQSNRDVAFVARRRRNPPRIQLWSLKVLSDFLPLTFSSSESFSLQVYSSESNLVVLDPIFLNCFLFVSQSISSPGRRNELEEPSVPPSP